MLSREDNEALTQSGPGTLMGDLLRRYWVPILRSEALVADGAPQRVTIMGERYVAFRDTQGRVGVFNESCPHRCASLALARNEQGGLRCIYHGWKFDVTGAVLDVPTEPADHMQAFAAKVPSPAYPARDAGGMVWAFFAKGIAPPKFPEFEYMRLPASHVHVRRAIVPCNWVQAMEAVLDSAHLGILHSTTVAMATTESAKVQQVTCLTNTAPRIKYVLTPYGYREAALREQPDGTVDTRIREFVAPWHAFLPLNPNAYRQLVTTVPIDDTHCLQFFTIFHSQRPLTADDIGKVWFSTHGDLDDMSLKDCGPDNLWGQDRAAMAEGHFSGLTKRHVFHEDFAVLESMGAIVDRTREYLCQTDATVILTRRELLKAARALRASGAAPWGLAAADQIDFGRIRAIATQLPGGQPWEAVDAFAV